MPSFRNALLLVFLSSIITLGQSQQQDCPPLTESIVADLIEQFLESRPTVHSFKPLCLAHGTRLNQYRGATVVANTTEAIQISLISSRCGQSGNWETISLEANVNSSIFDMELNENCSSCTTTLGSLCTRKRLLLTTVLLIY